MFLKIKQKKITFIKTYGINCLKPYIYLTLIIKYKDMNHLPKIPHDENINISSDGLSYILNNYDASCPERNFLWTSDYHV